MSEPTPAEAYWQAFVQSQPDPEALARRFYEIFHFGNSPELTNEETSLVMDGTKTATSALVWEVEAQGKRFVQPAT